jgi:hypothetical protein
VTHEDGRLCAPCLGQFEKVDAGHQQQARLWLGQDGGGGRGRPQLGQGQG